MIDRTPSARLGVLLIVAAAITVALAALRHAPDPVPEQHVSAVVASPAQSLDHITLHVSGAVGQPGLVEVEATSRVADAIAAAGGALPAAELSAINLAAPVSDGMQLIVPDAASSSDGAVGSAGGLIDINTATAAELMGLPGVGPVLAGRIASHREEHGPFGTVEDLLDVSGIGEGKLDSIREVGVVR